MNSRHSDSQSALSDALRAVAASTANESAPAEMENRLLQAYRRRTGSASHLPHVRRIAAIAALLAFALLAAGIMLWRTPVQSVKATDFPKHRFTLPNPPADSPIVFAQASRSQESQKSAQPVVSDFIPLGYSDTSPDSYQVVRVKMDRTSLAQFGVPVNPERSDELLDADLLVGDDGMPRAVRFITYVSDPQ